MESIEQIRVRGGGPLEGTIPVSGAKNSVLKLMAATLLAEGTYHLHNVPRITDVDLMSDLLCATGCSVARDGTTLRIDVPAEIEPVAPYEIVEQFRASIAVMGPMLARCGEARVAMPGGDDFGPRPIDMHVRGLQELGAEFDTAHGYIHARSQNLQGARVLLEFPSVGATENLVMAAVRAKGTTVIDNAAREPEIADLCELLNKMGAQHRCWLIDHHDRWCRLPGRAPQRGSHRHPRSHRGRHLSLCCRYHRWRDHPRRRPSRTHVDAVPEASARWGCGSRMTPTAFGRSPHGA